MEGQEDKFVKIARAMELKKKNGEAVIDHLFSLNKKIGLPRRLGKIGVKHEHIEPLADLAIADFCHPSNPRPVTRDDFRKIYLEAL
jgi:alcohol dehydrogenase class IV